MAKVRFRTNALLKSIIGKDLITDDNNAVLELVKNSFDAGSTTVDLIFDNILKNDDSEKKRLPTENSSTLIIQDYGIGMSEYDLTEKWLNIAYSEKKVKKEDFGRVLAGNKGVGRFSCDRLGRFLTIYSRKKNQEYKKLFIDWKVFEKEGDIDFNIQDVELEIETISPANFYKETGYKPFECGTILEITYLREFWHSNKILGLRRQLERLINPNQAFKKNQFSITIHAHEFLQHDKSQGEYEKINGEVKNRIFEKLDFKTSSIQASLDAKGEFLTTTLQDRGKEIFLLKERNPYSQLRNINITVYYLNTYSKMYFAKQTGIRSFDFGSIYLFINGFRIPPYGDIGDDWLGMETRKGQGYNRFLGTREVVGRIEINDNNETFKIISNRSGVVNNVAFEQLTKSNSPYGLYYRIFRRLERFVVDGIKWDSTPDDISIESKIYEKKWDESKERYYEDALTRNKRVLSVINSIIGKKDEIIDLKINDEFVKEIIGQQTELAKTELENILNELNDRTKDFSPDDLGEILNKISKNSKELGAFSAIIDSYSDASKKGAKELNSIQKTFTSKYTELLESKQKLEKKLQEEAEARQKAEEDKRIAEEKLAIEKDKNTYLLASKRTLSDDAKGLIHNVKLTSRRSKQNAQNLYEAILEDRLKKAIALKWVSEIIYNSDKALKISNLITRANFKADADYQDVNIVKFVEQYFELYNVMYDENELKFTIESKIDEFEKRISVLDLSLILDDLISNSAKANAKNVKICLDKTKQGDLNIIFGDDGKGLSKKFIGNEDVIFDLGVTTTDGSGIGLNYVRTTLSKMQGSISFEGNGQLLKGATFKILIAKSYK
ncbi:MAG: ATP-binding protein [Candidatus Kuenenia stuttgartiensis]|nr:ATP-binding protein [Candidatus Kuenenia stuttgartiensis]